MYNSEEYYHPNQISKYISITTTSIDLTDGAETSKAGKNEIESSFPSILQVKTLKLIFVHQLEYKIPSFKLRIIP